MPVKTPRTVNGQWWIPAAPTVKQAGRLTLDTPAGPELEVLGDLGRRFDSPAAETPVLLGASENGTPYTCEGTHVVRGTGPAFNSSGFPGFPTNTYRTLRVYRGMAEAEPHNVRVKLTRFELDLLADWLNKNPIDQEPGDGSSDVDWTWTYKKLDPIIVNLGDARTLEIHRTASMGYGRGISLDVPIAVKLVIKWTTPVSLRDAERTAHAIRFFFAFAMARGSAIKNLEFVRADDGRVADALAEGDAVVDDLIALRPSPGIPFCELDSILEPAIRYWLQLNEDNRGLVELVGADLYGQAGLQTSQFLTLATALEAYHRLDVERRPRRAPRADGKWELKHRLEDLWKRLASVLDAEIPNPQEKPGRLADVRNYYSHYMRDAGARKPKSHEEMQNLIRVSRVLLHGLIMSDMGVSDARIRATARHWMGITTYTLPGIDIA